MLQVAGYQLTQHIHTNDRVAIFKAIRTIDNTRCYLLKPGNEQARQRDAKDEFILLSGIDSEFIASPCDLVEDEHTCLVLDDIPGISLTQSQSLRQFSSEQLISVGLKLLIAMEDLHKRGLLYANFSTDSIFYHRESQTLKLMDFSSAVSINTMPEMSELPRLTDSPEQTGFTGRPLDERSDHYGLGLILYKLATGQYPNEFAINLRHDLIFRAPASVYQLRRDLPPDLAVLIDRLLQPNPEDRPGSTAEIRKILDRNWFTPTGYMPKFYLSRRVRGRKPELEKLLTAMEGGSPLSHIIAGPSGIGKSLLADELCKYAATKQLTVLKAKFDLDHVETPYFGVTDLLTNLINQIFRRRHTANQLIEELGESARYLLRAFPSLSVHLNHEPSGSGEISASENLVSRAIAELFQLVNSRGINLLVFLDDLQWMDNASASVIKTLLALNLTGVNFLGGWRHEKDADLTLDDFLYDTSGIDVIELAPFTVEDTQEVIQDSFGQSANITSDAVDAIFKQTKGYPHFVAQTLGEIVRDGAAKYSAKETCWEIHQNDLSHLPPTENEADILVRQLKGYDRDFREALELAACFGHSISRQMYIDLSSQDHNDIKYFIDRASADGLLTSQRNLITFAHDTIHEVVYASIPTVERQRNHERIAALLERYSERDGVDRKFEIANQYKLYPGLELSPPDFRCQVAEACVAAGAQAMKGYAFHAALDYLLSGIELLSDQSWHRQSELKSELFYLASDTAYLLGDLHRAQTLLGVLIENSSDAVMLANSYRIKMKVDVAQNNIREALESGHRGLEAVGYKTPKKISGIRAYLTLRWLLFTLRKGSFPTNPTPEGRSATGYAAVLLYANLIGAASRVGDPTIAIYVTRMLKTSLRNNDLNEAGSTLCFFAVSVKNFFNDVEESYRIGKLAQEMSTRTEYYVTNTTLLDGVIFCWKEHITDTGHRLLDAYRFGIKTEDVEVAILAALHGAGRLFFTGMPLSSIQTVVEEIYNDANRLNQASQARIESVYKQAIRNLRNGVDEPWELLGDLLSESDFEAMDASGKAHFLIASAYIAVLFGNYGKARDYISKTGPNLPAIKGLPQTHTYYFVECLTLLAEGADRSNKRLRQQLGKLTKSSNLAPMNFSHQVKFIEAKLSDAAGDPTAASALYRSAAELAETYEHVSDWGLVCEQASGFFERIGDSVEAERMQRVAKQAYSRWELESKLELIVTR